MSASNKESYNLIPVVLNVPGEVLKFKYLFSSE